MDVKKVLTGGGTPQSQVHTPSGAQPAAPAASPPAEAPPGATDQWTETAGRRTFLVINGERDVPKNVIQRIEDIAHAEGATERLPSGEMHPHAFRLSDVVDTPKSRQQVAALLHEEDPSANHGWVPGTRTMAQVGAVFWDVDKTLTPVDTLIEILQGLGKEVFKRDREMLAEFKKLAEQHGLEPFGEEYKESRRERTRVAFGGVLETKVTQILDKTMREKGMNPGIDAAVAGFDGAEQWCISCGVSPAIERVADAYNLRQVSTELEVEDGFYTGEIIGEVMVPQSKAKFVEGLELPPDKILVAVGDGFTDIDMFCAAQAQGGLAVAFNADQRAQDVADIVVDGDLADIRNYFLPRQ